MSNEFSLASELAAQRRPGSRRWLWIALSGILLTLFLFLCVAFSPLANSNAPDTMRLVSVLPSQDGSGNFQVRLRLLRADGKALGTSLSFTADLLTPDGGKRVLGRQCGFQMDRQNDARSIDVILIDRLPASTKQPLPVQAWVQTRAIPPLEALHFMAWRLSGQRLPQPAGGQSGYRTFTAAATLPPSPRETTSSSANPD